MKDYLIYVTVQLLKKNAIFFDKQELAFQIQSHPSYPSLHAVTGVLDHFNIDNIAAEVPQNLETLLELPNCFLAQVETEKGKDKQRDEIVSDIAVLIKDFDRAIQE